MSDLCSLVTILSRFDMMLLLYAAVAIAIPRTPPSIRNCVMELTATAVR